MKRIFGSLLLVLLSTTTANAACEKVSAKYGVAKTIDFCLWETDATDFKVDATITAGEVKISKDEGAEANCATGTGACVTDEGSCYSILLTSAEMTTARAYVTIIDTAAKTFLDHCIVVETYGNTAAEHAFDLDAPPNDGVTTSETAATPAAGQSRYGLASGAIDADNQFVGNQLVVYDAAGLVSANACIFASANAGDTVDLRADITALTAVGDAYIIVPDAGCAADVARWNGTAVPTSDTLGYPKVTLKDGTGTGEIDTNAGAVVSVTTTTTATTASTCTVASTCNALGATAKTDVNTEVRDVLMTDTNAELGAVPGATPTILEMLQWVYQLMRFQITQTSTTATSYKANSSTTLGTSTTSDDGTTFTRGKYN